MWVLLGPTLAPDGESLYDGGHTRGSDELGEWVDAEHDRVEIPGQAGHAGARPVGGIVGEHARRFGRGQTIYDPWHYVPVLARKPGALRNGAPFKNWALPGALGKVRAKLAGRDDGDRHTRQRRSHRRDPGRSGL